MHASGCRLKVDVAAVAWDHSTSQDDTLNPKP